MFILLYSLFGCTESIKTAAVCGNEILELNEDCDDGNNSDSDACANDCSANTGFEEFQSLLDDFMTNHGIPGRPLQ